VARAGVLVRAPVYMPAATTRSTSRSATSSRHSTALATISASTTAFSRMPPVRIVAKKLGPDESPIVYTNSTRPSR
jgi:hypothetical protein